MKFAPHHNLSCYVEDLSSLKLIDIVFPDLSRTLHQSINSNLNFLGSKSICNSAESPHPWFHSDPSSYGLLICRDHPHFNTFYGFQSQHGSLPSSTTSPFCAHYLFHLLNLIKSFFYLILIIPSLSILNYFINFSFSIPTDDLTFIN